MVDTQPGDLADHRVGGAVAERVVVLAEEDRYGVPLAVVEVEHADLVADPAPQSACLAGDRRAVQVGRRQSVWRELLRHDPSYLRTSLGWSGLVGPDQLQQRGDVASGAGVPGLP